MTDQFRPPEQGTLRSLRDVALIVPRVFRFMWEVTPGFLTVALALMVVTAVIPAAIVYMTKVIIDGVVGASGGAIVWAAVSRRLPCCSDYGFRKPCSTRLPASSRRC